MSDTFFPQLQPWMDTRKSAPTANACCSGAILLSSQVLVPIGTGSEEMEAVITVDVLRRAGAEVTVASVEDSLEIKCSRSVKVVADKLIGDCAGEEFDLIALPVSAQVLCSL